MRVLILVVSCLIAILPSCRLYTESGARKAFGCDTTSFIDSSKAPVLITKDSTHDTIYLPGSVVYTKSPCDEIAKMKPGQSTTKKNGNTTQQYGKDSLGNDYFKSSSDSLIRVSSKYREWWLKTNEKNNYMKDKPVKIGWFEKTYNNARNAFALLGLILILVIIVSFAIGKVKIF